jgi:uncharacterized protein YccT (UPF0319 family)
MLKFVGITALLIVGLVAVSSARKEETVQELVARAEAAKVEQQPDLYMEAAERQRRVALDALKAEHWDEFHQDLKDIAEYSDKAHKAAIAASKKVKNTEIKIRRISTHLRETKMNVSVDDQPAVQAVIDQLEQFRTELLRSMFGNKRND